MSSIQSKSKFKIYQSHRSLTLFTIWAYEENMEISSYAWQRQKVEVNLFQSCFHFSFSASRAKMQDGISFINSLQTSQNSN